MKRNTSTIYVTLSQDGKRINRSDLQPRLQASEGPFSYRPDRNSGMEKWAIEVLVNLTPGPDESL